MEQEKFLEISLGSVFLLGITGFLAGGINTVAGGGSNLTLPALMILGLPADIANGTNRVAIALQCVVGLAGYDKHETLDRSALVPILIPSIVGGICGAIAAALMPNLYLKPILLGTILLMALIILIRPEVIAPLQAIKISALATVAAPGGGYSQLEFTAVLCKQGWVSFYWPL